MVSFLKNNLIILIIILILGSYLGVKALDENGWDGWGFGSPQILMSSQYWAKDGFAKNYFLFIPSPYSKLIKYLDESEFRNRTIDDFDGALKRNRIYYTHYPPLYLFPYALMAKIGIESRAVFRVFSLLISLAALSLFYLFIKSISTRAVAIIASIYYGLSVTFLNYADSIATQPLTIFFTFLILYLSVFAARHNFIIWIAYLALSLSSYDATFFVFAWLILYDAAVLQKFLWRKWLFWTSAPILGFTLQIIQNTWYLGLQDMISDFSRIYANRTFVGVKNFIVGLIAPFYSMTSIKTVFIFKKTIVVFASATAILGVLWKFRQRIGLNSDYFKIVLVLAVAAVVQPFFVNITGSWPYSGVLTAPFWGLLMSAATVFIINTLKQKEWNALKNMFFWTLTLIILLFWSAQFYNTLNYAKDWPNNRPDQKVIEFSKEIKNFYPNEEKIAFRILPENPIWKSSFPVFNFEYYLDMPKIDFANNKDLLVDFWWFRNRSEYPFYSFIISENKSDVEKIRRELIAKNVKNISLITEIQSQYLFTVGPIEK